MRRYCGACREHHGFEVIAVVERCPDDIEDFGPHGRWQRLRRRHRVSEVDRSEYKASRTFDGPAGKLTRSTNVSPLWKLTSKTNTSPVSVYPGIDRWSPRYWFPV